MWDIADIFFGIVLLGCVAGYLATLDLVLSRCSKANRAMRPGLLWLIVIPVIGYAWECVVVLAVDKSLRKEYLDRGMRARTRPSLLLGLATSVAALTGAILTFVTGLDEAESLISGGFVSNRPLAFANVFLCVIAGVTWVLYWIAVARLSKPLASPSEGAEISADSGYAQLQEGRSDAGWH